MKYLILSQAELELKEAVIFYNNERSGLGFEFALEVEKTIERIIKHPHAW